MKKLFVFYCDNFEGFYPVGTAAVVVAENAGKAEELLKQALPMELFNKNRDVHLTMKQLNTSVPGVIIVNDGNY